MELKDFTADSIWARLEQQREAKRAEEQAMRDAAAAHHRALRQAFETRQLPPDALERVMRLVNHAVGNGQKEALVYRFPSDFMKDSGRSITSQIGDWTQQLTGAGRIAYDFYKRELEPRGFTLRACILDYKDDMPGDVGFYLGWEKDEI
jgi:hypothetical protein